MSTMDTPHPRRTPWRLIGWSVPIVLLLIPLVAAFPWTPSDYVVMGVLLGGVGLLIELAIRVSDSWAYRAGAALAVVTGFLLIWVNLAVGFLGGEANPWNLLFLGVLAIGFLVAVAGGLRPAAMIRATLTAAGAQIAIGLAALVFGLGSPGSMGMYEALMGTALFTALWLGAAGLFRIAR